MKTIFLFLGLSVFASAYSQTSVPDDTSSVDNVIKAIYGIISGPAGKRDWTRFKNLFDKEGTMGIIYENRSDGKILYKKFSPDDYIANNDPYFLKNGFVEVETARSQNIIDDIAQVFSNYEYTSNGISRKGVNTFLLYRDKNRWFISSLIWKEEPLVDGPDDPNKDKGKKNN